MHANHKGILIAICRDLDHFLSVARTLPFVPEALTASAEKNGFPQFPRLRETFAAHIGYGEDLSRGGILNNSGDQPVRFPSRSSIFFMLYSH
jgi:hypothetical protein